MKRLIILTTALVSLMLMTPCAYGAIPNNSVIIWSKAYSIDYLMDVTHISEINQAIANAGSRPIYFQLSGVAENFTDVFTMAAANQTELAGLPEIEYTDAQGDKTTYAAGFGEEVTVGEFRVLSIE